MPQVSPLVIVHRNRLSPHLPKDLPTSTALPTVVYLRLFAPLYLSQYKRVLYVDADTIPVRRDDIVWQIELPGGLAAVRDYGLIGRSPVLGLSWEGWLRSIGKTDDDYFNAGILLIDVDKWRHIDFLLELRNYVGQYRSAMRFQEQDFLNYFFQNRWTEMSPAFNFQYRLWNFGIEEYFMPIFLHTTKAEKPWMSIFYNKCEDLEKSACLSFKQMADNAGIGAHKLQDYASKSEKPFLSKIENELLRISGLFGFASSRERRLRQQWSEDRLQFERFFSRAITGRYFADLPDFPRPVFVTTNVLFDGKYLRAPLGPRASQAISIADQGTTADAH